MVLKSNSECTVISCTAEKTGDSKLLSAPPLAGSGRHHLLQRVGAQDTDNWPTTSHFLGPSFFNHGKTYCLLSKMTECSKV